jgi:phosphatidylserine/phosphatidylglycerophosphate/cardiolipin synthase-like enzyme
VLVVGYAVYQGRVVFEALANRMLENPKLTVRMFLDIKRDAADTSASSELIHRFTHRFRTEQWPQERPIPRVYYYPAALDLASKKKASLHAKCIVVDLQDVFVSSANFTEAAQYRNIEMGLLVRSASLANRVTGHFETLLENGLLAEAIVP